jgi:putative nucleotidyltransferase with HDIG domain
MDRFKRVILANFERLLVTVILLVAFLGTYYIEHTAVVMNFYFLPVLVAGYFLGRRSGLSAAVLSIAMVILCAVLFPDRLFGQGRFWQGVASISGWGGFLLLTSVAVGTLYEIKEMQIKDLRHAYIGVLEILSKYLEASDPYTKGHSTRVAELAVATASEMCLSSREIDNIRVAALLHDVGKIEISGDVLHKAAQLSESEREYVDSHSERGARLLSSVGSVLQEVVPIVLSHHKYFADSIASDGQPNSEAIPLGARIVAVADSFDAMTSDRPYRRAKPPWEALEEIVRNSGKQFDPKVVEAFKIVAAGRLEVM